MSEREQPQCPSCGHDLNAEVVAQVRDQSRMSVRVAPNDGELLTAATVGSFIRNFGRLMTTIGQTQGAKTEVLVERIKTDEDGAVTATVLVCRRKPLNADGDTP